MSRKQKCALFISTGAGSGLAPLAPGTAGTVVAIPIYIIIITLVNRLELATGVPANLLYVIAVGLCCWVGIRAADITSVQWNRNDPPEIVIDEIIGYLITMIALPLNWYWISAGFVLFRILDIAKIWPACWVDKKISGGLGIVLDDLVAGAMGCIILNIINWVIF